MSIFNRIFRGGRDDSQADDDSRPAETPAELRDTPNAAPEDAPTDIDVAPDSLQRRAPTPPARGSAARGSAARGSAARGAPLPPPSPSASTSDSSRRSYHPALRYTPPAGLVLPGAGAEDDDSDTAPESPAPQAGAQSAAAAPSAAPTSPASRVKTEPMPKPPLPGAARRLTPLPPGAATRARRPSKPLRRQTPAPVPTQNPDRSSAPVARPKTQPGSGDFAPPTAVGPSPAARSRGPAAPKPPTPSATAAGKSDGKIQAALGGMDTQQLRANVDSAFSDLEGGSNGAGAVEVTERDLESVRALFEDMAADYMARVRDFMIEVRWGEASPSWAGRCEPVVRSLRRFADKVGHAELSNRLKAYGIELARARRAGGAQIAGEAARPLIAAFDALAQLLPSVFELDKERDRREPIIVEALLRQVPVRRVALDKLHAAGLHQLRSLFAANVEDVASLAGIPVEVARGIVTCFADYRKTSDTSLSAADLSAEHRRLKALVAELSRDHQAYERAARQWSAEALANKRHYRAAREQATHKIAVCLARLGQLDELRAVERQCYADKLGSLRDYLARAAAAGLGRLTTSTEEGDEHRP